MVPTEEGNEGGVGDGSSPVPTPHLANPALWSYFPPPGWTKATSVCPQSPVATSSTPVTTDKVCAHGAPPRGSDQKVPRPRPFPLQGQRSCRSKHSPGV